MPGLSKQQTLAALRARIDDIEQRPVLAEGANLAVEGIDGLPVLPPGIVHEVFTDTNRNAGAALGFALGAAKGMLTKERPVLLVMQMARHSQDMGVPYGAGLKSFGLDPCCLILCRTETPIELLWATEEAIACNAVAAVIADVGREVKALDFTATRRLSLRAAAGGGTVFLVRYGVEREATAARLRWRIEPVSSGSAPFDARAPTHPRWRVHLEKGRLGRKRGPINLVLDWTQNGFERVDAKADAGNARRSATLSGSASAALGDRLSEAS